jgi:hypothetical protein
MASCISSFRVASLNTTHQLSDKAGTLLLAVTGTVDSENFAGKAGFGTL